MDISGNIIKILETMLHLCILDLGESLANHQWLVEFAYDNSYEAKLGMAMMNWEAMYIILVGQKIESVSLQGQS